MTFPVWCPREESNLDRLVRSEQLYPLSYEGDICSYKGCFLKCKPYVVGSCHVGHASGIIFSTMSEKLDIGRAEEIDEKLTALKEKSARKDNEDC